MFKKRIACTLVWLLLLSGLTPAGLLGSGTVRAAESPVRSVPGWTFYYSGLTRADYALDAGQAANGTQSLKFANDSAKAPNVYLTAYQTIPVKPNTDYSWTVQVRGANVKANGVWFGGGVTGGGWTDKTFVPAGTFDWQDMTVTHRTTTETSYTLRFVIEGMADAVWFDDIRMTEAGQPANALRNPGFDDPVETLLQEGFEHPTVWTEATGTAGTIGNEPFGPATEGAQSSLVTYEPAAGAEGWLNHVWNFPVADLSRAGTVTLDVYPTTQTASSKEPLVLKLSGSAGTVLESQLPRLAANRWNTVQFDLSKASAAIKSKAAQINLYVKTTYAELEGRARVSYGFDNLRITAPTRTAPVTASPAAGAVKPGTAITLSTATPEARIFYTLDESDPVSSDTRTAYSAPIPVNGPVTVKAYAVKEGYDASPVQTFVYTIDTTPPEEAVLPWDSFRQSFGGQKQAAVLKADGFTLDGDLSEWGSLSGLTLPASEAQVVYTDGWGGEDDLSARVHFAYDDENLYWAAKVRDNAHNPLSGSSIWKGDGIQIAFGDDGIYGPEMTFHYMNGTVNVQLTRGSGGSLGLEHIKAAGARIGDETVYEVRMPWETIYKARPATDRSVFTLVINDNDNTDKVRRGWIEWTPGIAGAKDPDAMASLYRLAGGADWAFWADGPRKAQADAGTPYTLYTVNDSDQPRTFEWSSAFLGLRQQLNVPARSVLAKRFPVTFTRSGDNRIDLRLTDAGGVSRQTELVVRVPLFAGELNDRLDAVAAKLPALQRLLAQAEAAGIPTDYERVPYTVVSRFIEYGKADIANGELDRAAYVVDQLERLYDEAERGLRDYLSGARTAKAAPRYVTGRPELNRYAFVGDTVVRSTYKAEERPIFFNGYGHFSQVRRDIPHFQDFGANMIQIEIGPRHVVFSPDNAFSVNKNKGVDADVEVVDTERHSGERSLKIANRTPRQNDVYVNVMQRVAVKPNTTYTFRAWVKGDNAKDVWFPGGAGWKQRTPFPSGTYDWTQVTADYTTGPDETFYTFTVLSENAGTVWVDDLSMTERGSDNNLLLTPGFENAAPGTEYIVSTAAVENDIVYTLERAERHDIAVNLLLSPHYFPDWAYKRYPELKSGTSAAYGPDLDFVFDHPMARKIIEAYLRAVIPLVKDHPSLHSVTLTNEPQYHSHMDDYNLPEWHRYLSRTYGDDLAELNRIHGASYASFDDVPMPQGAEPTPAGYDWAMFNGELFTGWHEWMAGIIHDIAPSLPVHAKIMGHFDKSPQYGIDIEALAGFADISGNDSWNFIGGGISAYMKELSFYDLQASLREAPVYNSEHHVIEDGDGRYGPEYGTHIRSVLWQGALHGKSASTLWIWERTYDDESSAAGGILHRPESVAAVGRTGLDLNRLAREVVALQNAEPHAAILYAVPSLIYNPGSAHQTMLQAYEALSFTGEKAAFITEKQMAEGLWSRYKVLIVPGATHVKPETVQAIKAFQAQGGSVLVVGARSLQRDERSRPSSATDVADVIGGSVLVEEGASAPQIRSALLPVLEREGLARLRLIDEATGRPAYGVEWRTAEYEGRTLLSATNMSNTPVTASVYRDGSRLTPVSELIEGVPASPGPLVLKPETPYLFDLGDVVKAGTTLELQSASGSYSDTVPLAARLTDRQGNPVAGETITYAIPGVSFEGSAVTGEDGTAILRYRAEHGISAGNETQTWDVTARYSPPPDRPYAAAEAAGTVVVGKEAASIRYTGMLLADSSGVAKLAAQVLPEPDGEPGRLDGLPVRFAIRTVSADGTKTPYAAAANPSYATDATGTAEADLRLPPGVYEIAAELAPNGYYRTAQTAAVTAAVYESGAGPLQMNGTFRDSGVRLHINGRFDERGEWKGSISIRQPRGGLRLDGDGPVRTARSGNDRFVLAAARDGQGSEYTVLLQVNVPQETGPAAETVSLQVWSGGSMTGEPVLRIPPQRFNGHAGKDGSAGIGDPDPERSGG
ncbi:beta-galactosidase [Paenibacillus flagellatus]|uniref:beta-galactosidase n=1 Tax=Paenibacillus flagellatus TaxID=2211139 RepID=UPI00130521B4|nr:beta-galactosidase [Paenibacillus flagellatus]